MPRIATVILTIAFSALVTALVVQTARLGAEKSRVAHLHQAIAELKAHYAAQTVAATEKALANVAAEKEKTDAALRLAETRSRELAAHRRAAAVEHRRLRDTIAAATANLPAAPCETCREYAATAGELLEACHDEQRELAEKADGHAADVKTLIDVWPGGN